MPLKDWRLVSPERKGACGGRRNPEAFPAAELKVYMVWGRISGIGWSGNSMDDSPGKGGSDLSRLSVSECGLLDGSVVGVSGPERLDSVLEELRSPRPRVSVSALASLERAWCS